MFGGMFSTTYLVPFAFRAEGFMFRKSMTIKPFFNDISWSGNQAPTSIELESSCKYLSSAAFWDFNESHTTEPTLLYTENVSGNQVTVCRSQNSSRCDPRDIIILTIKVFENRLHQLRRRANNVDSRWKFYEWISCSFYFPFTKFQQKNQDIPRRLCQFHIHA